MKNYNENFESNIEKLIQELITKNIKANKENPDTRQEKELFDDNTIKIEKVQSSHDFDDNCIKVRDVIFTPEELLRSISLKKQWCEILPIYNQGICSVKGHNHFNRLGPIGPKCKFPMESYGLGDQEKRACGLKILEKEAVHHECIVFGFGSYNQWEFEEAIFDKTICKIFTLDCFFDTATVPKRISERTTFIPVCIGGKDEILNIKNKQKTFITYTTLLKRLNITHSPTFVKMDIEGYEYDVIDSMLQGEDLLPLQIAVEIHNHHNGKLPKMLDTLQSKGYDLIDRHDNPYCDDCSEVVLAKTRCSKDESRSFAEYCENKILLSSRNFSDILNASEENKLFQNCIELIVNKIKLI